MYNCTYDYKICIKIYAYYRTVHQVLLADTFILYWTSLVNTKKLIDIKKN